MDEIVKYLLIIVFFINTSVVGQEINAVIECSYQKEDSLLISLSLENKLNERLYFFCNVDELVFKDYIPIRVNYGDTQKASKINGKETKRQLLRIKQNSKVKDTLKLTLPETENRFQVNFKGDTVDVYREISVLRKAYGRLNMDSGQHVPHPPSDREYLEMVYVDMDLYRLLKKENIEVEEEGCLFCGQTIIFEPGETKTFTLDLSYLLLRKATYQLVFDCKTDNKLLRNETKFLKRLGFHRFKGRITSNVINVVSE